jgi:hypothetical protein
MRPRGSVSSRSRPPVLPPPLPLPAPAAAAASPLLLPLAALGELAALAALEALSALFKRAAETGGRLFQCSSIYDTYRAGLGKNRAAFKKETAAAMRRVLVLLRANPPLEDLQLACRNACLFFECCFPYVCPEPVLVK